MNQTPELVYPASPRNPRGLFEFSNTGMGAKASVRNLRFHIGRYTYIVFRSTAVHDPETAGVEVSRDGKQTLIECKANVYSDTPGVASVYHVDEQHFYEIQNIDLPEIARDELVY
ncbi:hypothetical protein [Roseateles sp.]|uniref:hypothetical protein n=1 Tax=Roseateles sp. TaxID=1971397 RepID=UPI002E18DDC2